MAASALRSPFGYAGAMYRTVAGTWGAVGVRPVGRVYGLALDSLAVSCLAAGGPYDLRTLAELGRELAHARSLAERRLLPYEQLTAGKVRGGG